jgi:hypothetical protein
MIGGVAALLDAKGAILAGNRRFMEQFGPLEALKGKVCASVVSCMHCDDEASTACPLHFPANSAPPPGKDYVVLATRYGEARVYPLSYPNAESRAETFVLHFPDPRPA